MIERYCEVALPVPLRTAFTYAVPEELNGEELVGRRLIVPFRNRAMVGVGIEVSDRPPKAIRSKNIAEVLDAVPALPPKLIELGRWVSRYYLAPLGETLRAMLPPEIELRHEREYRLTDAGHIYLEELRSAEERTDVEAKELCLLGHIDSKAKKSSSGISSKRLARLREGERLAEVLVRRGLLIADEIARRRISRTQKIVAWNAEVTEPLASEPEDRIREFLTATRGPVPLPVLIAQAKARPALVSRLQKIGRLFIWEEPLATEEDPWDTDFKPPANELNTEQNRSLEEISRWLLSGKFVTGLLHGVTGSGKKEVYLGAIEAALSRGKTAIVLVPEIALTLWLGRLARARFGEGVTVLHSGLPDVERAREWWRVRSGKVRVVVGTRSAVFAPLENLGLIIVDEEQEASYKQEETPRYQARDTAVYRARLEGAVALLGSATP